MRIGANVVVQRDRFQNIEQLAFVFVHAFDLNVEHRRRIDFDTDAIMDQLRQTDFIVMFDRSEFCAESRVFGKRNQVFQLRCVVHEAIADGFAE